MEYTKHMKFDMKKDPRKPLPITKRLFWLITIITNASKTKIEKVGFKDFKEPTLIIGNHHCTRDFGNLQKAMFPSVPIYVIAVDEFIRGETFLRMVGSIPKIKWTWDIRLILRIRRALNEYKSCVAFFPRRNGAHAE